MGLPSSPQVDKHYRGGMARRGKARQGKGAVSARPFSFDVVVSSFKLFVPPTGVSHLPPSKLVRDAPNRLGNERGRAPPGVGNFTSDFVGALATRMRLHNSVPAPLHRRLRSVDRRYPRPPRDHRPQCPGAGRVLRGWDEIAKDSQQSPMPLFRTGALLVRQRISGLILRPEQIILSLFRPTFPCSLFNCKVFQFFPFLNRGNQPSGFCTPTSPGIACPVSIFRRDLLPPQY